MSEAGKYPQNYYTGHGYGADPKRAAAYQQEAERIQKRAGHNGGKIFDYGCGCGDFAKAFDDRWKVYGWDISEYARNQAAKNGVEIVTPFCETGMYNFFDAVVFRGTIQHIDDPVRALRFAYDALKPGGLLAIVATPNADSLCYQLFGTLPALDPPRNWHVWGSRDLSNALYNVGFGEVEVKFPYWQSPYAEPPHDFARFILRLFGVKSKFPFPRNMMEVYAKKP